MMHGSQCRKATIPSCWPSIVGAMTIKPFYDMWDVVTTCYLTKPEFFSAPTPMKLRVATSGDKEGALLPDPTGREVEVVMSLADSAGYYDYVLEQFAR